MAASLGWLFDAMDQRLFILARSPAVASLLGPGVPAAHKTEVATWVTALFIAGWATGGLIFGLFGDRWGRVRTMLATILTYSLFTGLSALAVGVWDFAAYRFLTGLGVGGEFAAGVALVAEVLPSRSRTGALGFLQVMAIIGTFIGTGLSLVFVPGAMVAGLQGWRWLFLVGLLPALLLVLFRRHLTESPAWLQAKETPGIKLGDLGELFAPGPLRRATIVGMLLGLAGTLGIWGAGTWTPELIRGALHDDTLTSLGLMAKDVGSMLGIQVFAVAAARLGRKWTFAVALIGSLIITWVTFGLLSTRTDVWWMMPLLGFFCWSLLGGYAIYYPELYPTRLRSSGIGFCYNVARYLTAVGLFGLGGLTSLFAGLGFAMPLRPAAMAVGLVYLVGLAALPFGPETRGRPLPE